MSFLLKIRKKKINPKKSLRVKNWTIIIIKTQNKDEKFNYNFFKINFFQKYWFWEKAKICFFLLNVKLIITN